MAFLAAAAPYITAASTALTVAGAVHEGEVAKQQAAITARELREDANARQADAQRVAIERRRQGVFAASRARAIAAASGAGVSDTTADLLIGRIEAQTDYNVLNALYEGDTAAKGLRDGARTAQREGRAARKASRYRALGSALRGASSFYDKYGSPPADTSDLDAGIDNGTAYADAAMSAPRYRNLA